MKNSLKTLRVKKGVTQQELADSLSVSRQTIIAIESGRFNPSTKLALKMSAFLGCTIHDIFVLEGTD